jgi:hypothetical protein
VTALPVEAIVDPAAYPAPEFPSPMTLYRLVKLPVAATWLPQPQNAATTFPEVVGVNDSEAVALFPNAVWIADSAVAPVSDTDPPLTPPIAPPPPAVTVTDTVCAEPVGGLGSAHTWRNPASLPSVWTTPRDVIATLLYVAVADQPVSGGSTSIVAPTSRYVAVAPQVCDQVSGLPKPVAPLAEGPTASKATATAHRPSGQGWQRA